MNLKEFLKVNSVTLWNKVTDEETEYLGCCNFAKGLENVVGKKVWICDFRPSQNIVDKPIRNIAPTEVVVADSADVKRTVYYSPICFFEIGKTGKPKKTPIVPFDNTGYRGYTGISVNIFETKEECVECYRKQVEAAKEIYKKELLRIQNEFNSRIRKCEKALADLE